MKAGIYTRVSSRKREESGYSLPAHKKLLKEYAKKNGFVPLSKSSCNPLWEMISKPNLVRIFRTSLPLNVLSKKKKRKKKRKKIVDGKEIVRTSSKT